MALEREILEKNSRIEEMSAQLEGVEVLKKTNERLYSELTELQNQLQKLESLNGSSMSMLKNDTFKSQGLHNILNNQ